MDTREQVAAFLAGRSDDQVLAEIRALEVAGPEALRKLLRLAGTDWDYLLAWAERHPCPRCQGTGGRVEKVLPPLKWRDCQECEGYGYDPDDLGRCEACAGEGKIWHQPPAEERRITCRYCPWRGLGLLGIDPDAVYDGPVPLLSMDVEAVLQRLAYPDEYCDPPPAETICVALLRQAKALELARRAGDGVGLWHAGDALQQNVAEALAELVRPGAKRRRNGTDVPQRIELARGQESGVRSQDSEDLLVGRAKAGQNEWERLGEIVEAHAGRAA